MGFDSGGTPPDPSQIFQNKVSTCRVFAPVRNSTFAIAGVQISPTSVRLTLSKCCERQQRYTSIGIMSPDREGVLES